MRRAAAKKKEETALYQDQKTNVKFLQFISVEQKCYSQLDVTAGKLEEM